MWGVRSWKVFIYVFLILWLFHIFRILLALTVEPVSADTAAFYAIDTSVFFLGVWACAAFFVCYMQDVRLAVLSAGSGLLYGAILAPVLSDLFVIL